MSGPFPHTIEKVTEKTPETLKQDEVLIRIHATALNFRDNLILAGQYPLPTTEHGVPFNDGAAEVISVGEGVRRFAVGDHVSPIVDLSAITGDEYDDPVAVGGETDGTLRQFAVIQEKHLVRVPEHLSWEEAATIPCAGTTAWSALNMPESIGKAKAALLEGTGGVSMFALVLCLAAGIRPIITSSSDAKLDEIRKLGPPGFIGTINYRTTSDIVSEVKSLTDGRGVDLVVANAGPSTWSQGLDSLARHGIFSVVGFVAGISGGVDPNTALQLIGKTARIQGIMAAPRVQNEKLNEFLASKKVRLDSIIDRTFEFDEAKEALDYLKSGKHTGKIIVKV
ncbi:hypothetical protein SLS57_012026 [Botryosphaeria dothidea]